MNNPLQARKQRTERLYAEVKNRAPDLYERAVQIASFTPNLSLEARMELERQCMSLALEALNANEV